MSARPLIAVVLMPLALSSAKHAPDASIDVRRTYFANGAIAAERRYIGDREEGRHVGWWENGRLRFDFTYRDGVMEGEAREWFEDGGLYRVTHYRRGQEEGAQQMWWPDGSLRASYAVRDGRRFGLLGAKGCVTFDSSDAAARSANAQ